MEPPWGSREANSKSTRDRGARAWSEGRLPWAGPRAPPRARLAGPGGFKNVAGAGGGPPGAPPPGPGPPPAAARAEPRGDARLERARQHRADLLVHVRREEV